MPSSQFSYDTRLNRFSTANDLIQAMPAYNPTNNPHITKAELVNFITIASSANSLVVSTLDTVNNFRGNRRQLSFKILGEDDEVLNPACMEMRIEGILGYMKSEFGTDSGEYKAVYRILKKIRPNYKKKDPEAPRGEGNSPMERSFLALPGQADAVITLITGLGSFSPADTNLSIANMQALNTLLKQANTNITNSLKTYGDANRARKKLFNSKGNPPGMDHRIIAVKGYLTSFPGGKKSNEYIEFTQAIKGT